jgi:hypothetical protein
MAGNTSSSVEEVDSRAKRVSCNCDRTLLIYDTISVKINVKLLLIMKTYIPFE